MTIFRPLAFWTITNHSCIINKYDADAQLTRNCQKAIEANYGSC